ncbi:MAG TPA: SAF domain-containing protein [Streptosporangiaceae bacterium]
MSDTGQGPGLGTAFQPQLGPGGNGAARPGQLRGLPRRRRPAMIALAIALIGAGILASAALYQRANHQVPVLMVTVSVPAGTQITSADIGTTTVAAGPGVHTIPARQLSQVVGLTAAVTLRPGTLLAPSELTTALPPGKGQVLVSLPLKPQSLPASGLQPGDHVLVTGTPGYQGQAQSGGPVVLTEPVPGIVQAVDTVPDQDGFDVVDLLVSSASGDSLAKQESTGQIELIVTSRSSR